MEDIAAKLIDILSGGPNDQGLLEAASGIGELLGGSDGENASADTDEDEAGIDMGMLLKLTKVIGDLGATDKNVELLKALRPYFEDERRKKVDEAIKIIKLLKLLPLLREINI